MNRRALFAIVILLAAVVVGALRTTAEPDRSSTAATDTGIELDPGRPPIDGLDPASGLPVVDLAQLPMEAADTVALILSGGPYPYDRDGSVFQNREELLPDRPAGHYREFTVMTPGEDDRGARRIVAGGDGELYYTADHYSSFVVIADNRDSRP